MRFLSYKTLKLISLALVVSVLVSQTRIIENILSPQKAYAVADLTVTWQGAGTGDTGPLFTISNMAPGQSSQKTITVQNGASSARPIGVKGLKTNETGGLGDVLDIVISRSGTDVYGGSTGTKTLTQFFTDSNTANGIPLGTLNPGVSAAYLVTITFQTTAGNAYQSKTVSFNLQLGLSIDIPTACQAITFTKTIYGTQGNDTINGTNGNDLIYGLEGNDKIDGGNGNDCIVGNEGNDKLAGGNGNDVLSGLSGDDKLDGGNGKDTLLGGFGNDMISGGNEDDQIFGDENNDTLDGGNGNDQLFGGSGDDKLTGGNGNDLLDGQANSDLANGENGKDTCIAEAKKFCEL